MFCSSPLVGRDPASTDLIGIDLLPENFAQPDEVNSPRSMQNPSTPLPLLGGGVTPSGDGRWEWQIRYRRGYLEQIPCPRFFEIVLEVRSLGNTADLDEWESSLREASSVPASVQRQPPSTPPIRIPFSRLNFHPPASEFEAGFEPIYTLREKLQVLTGNIAFPLHQQDLRL